MGCIHWISALSMSLICAASCCKVLLSDATSHWAPADSLLTTHAIHYVQSQQLTETEHAAQASHTASHCGYSALDLAQNVIRVCLGLQDVHARLGLHSGQLLLPPAVLRYSANLSCSFSEVLNRMKSRAVATGSARVAPRPCSKRALWFTLPAA